jgi:hypothetical protein
MPSAFWSEPVLDWLGIDQGRGVPIQTHEPLLPQPDEDEEDNRHAEACYGGAGQEVDGEFGDGIAEAGHEGPQGFARDDHEEDQAGGYLQGKLAAEEVGEPGEGEPESSAHEEAGAILYAAEVPGHSLVAVAFHGVSLGGKPDRVVCS